MNAKNIAMLLSFLLSFSIPSYLLAANSNNKQPATIQLATINSSINNKFKVFTELAPNVNPKVLKLALTAYQRARAQGLDNKQVLTIIDFSKPSNYKRMTVLNLKNDKVLYNARVAHGKNSGNRYARSFSNKNGSYKSSIGLYLTANSYIGHDGYALRLKGLDKGFNDHALRRAIVMHGAWYVANKFVKKYGLIGRSHGCFSLAKAINKPVINTIKNGTLLFAYAPVKSWLQNSKYLAA